MPIQTTPITLEETCRRLSQTPWSQRQSRVEAAAAARVARRREQAADATAGEQPPAVVHCAVATVQLTYKIPLRITAPADATGEELAELAELYVGEKFDADEVIARGGPPVITPFSLTENRASSRARR